MENKKKILVYNLLKRRETNHGPSINRAHVIWIKRLRKNKNYNFENDMNFNEFDKNEPWRTLLILDFFNSNSLHHFIQTIKSHIYRISYFNI